MEARLFPADTVPEYTTPEWYEGRETAPHLDQDAHRGRILLAAEHVKGLRDRFGFETVLDLGCGDGGLLSLLPDDAPAWGYDLQQSNVAASETRGVDVRYGDAVNGDVEWADMAVCTEMLEHLIDPHAFVRKIAQHAKGIVASSPFTETSEDHYGFHTWAWDQQGYRELIEQAGFTVTRHDTWSMFQVISAVQW